MDISYYIDKTEQLMRRQDALYHGAAAKFGLSDAAMWVLYFLSGSGGGVTQQELCSQSSFAKQTVNSAVKSLSDGGIVKLCPIAGTKNQKNVVLTDNGQRFCADTIGRLREAEKRAYLCVGEKELDAYLETLAKLTSCIAAETEKL